MANIDYKGVDKRSIRGHQQIFRKNNPIESEIELKMSLKNAIRQIEYYEKKKQEEEMDKMRRKIIKENLLGVVYAPVLNDFYNRF
jgi:DNA topoisomerase VI subunit B